jgi:hypothetical protein
MSRDSHCDRLRDSCLNHVAACAATGIMRAQSAIDLSFRIVNPQAQFRASLPPLAAKVSCIEDRLMGLTRRFFVSSPGMCSSVTFESTMSALSRLKSGFESRYRYQLTFLNFPDNTKVACDYCNFLNPLHQVFGLTGWRAARYPNAGLASPKLPNICPRVCVLFQLEEIHAERTAKFSSPFL